MYTLWTATLVGIAPVYARPEIPFAPLVVGEPLKSYNGTSEWASFDGNSYEFSYDADLGWSPQITVTSLDDNMQKHPIGVFISQYCQGSAWNIPLVQEAFGGSCSFGQVARQLCPAHKCHAPGNFTVTLSSLAPWDTNYILQAGMVQSALNASDTMETVVAPWQPRFFNINFGDLDSVDIRINSPDHVKALISIQNASCPIYDLPQNIKSQGIAQSISTQGLLVAKRPENGDRLTVVIVLVATPGMCNSKETSFFELTMEKSMPVSDYVKPVMYLFALYVGIFVIFLPLTVQWRRSRLRNEAPDSLELSAPNTVRLGRRTWDDGTYSKEEKFFFRSKKKLFVTDVSRKLPSVQRLKSMRYLWYLIIIALFYFLPVAQLVASNAVAFHRGEQDSCYYNFQCAKPLGLLPAFNNVVTNMGYIILGFLYILIVRNRLQAETQVKVSKAFSRDLGGFSGFSSSAGDLGTPDNARGVPQNPGIYYSLGFAMICEGVFSACYHVCPSTVNFQFDSSFMYLICILQILALYQRRHLDGQSQPHIPYLGMSIIIAFNVAGVYLQQWGYSLSFFYGLILLAYLLFAYYGSMTIYLVAHWKFKCSCAGKRVSKASVSYMERSSNINGDDDVPMLDPSADPNDASDNSQRLDHPQEHYLVRPLSNLLRCGAPLSAPFRRERMVLIFIVNFINSGCCIYAASTSFPDVPFFFLLVLILNTMMYYGYYTTMKLLNHERLTWKPIVCLLLSIGSWIPAMHYFNIPLISLDDNAAVSREHNKECYLFDFYDYHDLWHMLSAIGLFFGACMLMTLDDDLINKPRKSIRCW